MYKPIARFLLLFSLLLTLFLWARPLIHEAYRRSLMAVSRAVLGNDSAARKIQFDVTQGNHPPLDCLIRIINPDRPKQGELDLEFDSVGLGEIPAIFLISLTLATPIAWKRRLFALGAGGLVFHGYLLFALWIYISAHLPDVGLTTYPAMFATVLSAMEDTLVGQIGPSFVIPVLCWGLLCFRRDDFSRFVASPSGLVTE